MAAFVVAEEEEARIPRRVFRDRGNPLEELTDREIIERFRLSRDLIENLLNSIGGDIERPTRRSNALTPVTQLLVTLRYFAKGDFFSECGDTQHVSRASVSRSIQAVVTALNRRVEVKFPTTDPELQRNKNGFFQIAQFPGVIGAIDCTLVPITAPQENEALFVCRKGYHALNIQGVVDHELRFINAVCKWPGSVHDSFIFRQSALCMHMERGAYGWLLGDSGYPQKRFLMTPILRPANDAEHRYNTRHAQTRVVVERAFGVLKSRFRCLHKTGGCLPFSPERSLNIIAACMKLHNICTDARLPAPDPVPAADDDDDHENIVVDNQRRAQQEGIFERNRIVQRFR